MGSRDWIYIIQTRGYKIIIKNHIFIIAILENHISMNRLFTEDLIEMIKGFQTAFSSASESTCSCAIDLNPPTPAPHNPRILFNRKLGQKV